MARSIGERLQGLGAWWGGNGPQYMYQQQLAERQRMADEQRKRQEAQQRQGNTKLRAANTIRLARQRMEENPVAAIPAINELIMGIPGAAQGPLGKVKQALMASQSTGVMQPGQKEQLLNQAREQLRALDDSFVSQGLLKPETVEKPEEYTLAKGARRFRGDEMIAENPDEESQQREMREDRNGILRYIDTGEPVFPGVTDTVRSLVGKDYNSVASGLRNEVLKRTADFQEIANAWDKITVVADDPSGAGDLSMMFNYMKMLDPGSTVREGEFQQMAASGSLGQRLQAGMQRYLSGERLTDEQRNDFLTQGQRVYDSAKKTASVIEDQYATIGERFNIDRADIVISRPEAGGDELTEEERKELEELRAWVNGNK